MNISPVKNTAAQCGAHVKKAAYNALEKTIDGKATRIVEHAMQKEGSFTKFPIVFADVVLGGFVGLKDFSVNFIKNMTK